MIQYNTALCELIGRIQLLLLQFGHAIVDKDWCGKVTNPDYSRLYYVIGGSASIQSDDGILILSPGKWYLLPAGFSFKFSCEHELEQIYFHVKLCDFDRIDLLRNLGKPCAFVPNDLPMDLFQRCLGSRQITDALKLQQTISGILMTFLDKQKLSIESRDLSPCVAQAISYINHHLSVRLTIEEIADAAFVSKSALTKHFRKELSMSVHDYVSDAIMFEAEQLLLNSNLSILSISERFGFCDQFYFSKCFKEKFGVSPRARKKSVVL